MNDIINKLKNGEKLSECELRELCWSNYMVERIEGDDYRGQREIKTIIDVDGQLYAIDWMRGLTECQESEFLCQPYKVKKVEKIITQTVVTYEKCEKLNSYLNKKNN